MRLGQYIKQYLDNNDMSMRQFSQRAGVSTAYISMLIKGRADGTIPTPTIETYKAVAKAMCMTVDELVRVVDDTIAFEPRELSEREQLAVLVNELSDEQVHSLLALLGKR